MSGITPPPDTVPLSPERTWTLLVRGQGVSAKWSLLVRVRPVPAVVGRQERSDHKVSGEVRQRPGSP